MKYDKCCYNCEYRFIGCHSLCSYYAEYKKRQEKIRKNRTSNNYLRRKYNYYGREEQSTPNRIYRQT